MYSVFNFFDLFSIWRDNPYIWLTNFYSVIFIGHISLLIYKFGYNLENMIQLISIEPAGWIFLPLLGTFNVDELNGRTSGEQVTPI